MPISSIISITFITIRSNAAMSKKPATGHIRHFTPGKKLAFIQEMGCKFLHYRAGLGIDRLDRSNDL